VRAAASSRSREILLAATIGASISAALVWLAPPGADLAAHLYQRTLFLEHGFALWDNFWYAGRYSFITYSLLYYPLAAVFGIRVLAVATVGIGAAAFSLLVSLQWGDQARWASRVFAVVWACVVLTGEFPFALGIALALLSLCALQRGWRAGFGALVLLTAATSPLAFLLLCIVLAAVALDQPLRNQRALELSALVVGVAVAEFVVWRAFPSEGRFPFPVTEAAAAITFCLLGLAVTWRIASARVLQCLFVVYLCACVTTFLIPSSVGENVARLRFVAIPLAVLALSLRGWRPRPVVVGVLALAVSWNVTPLAATVAKGAEDPSAAPSYWQPAIDFLRANLPTSYRVEAVDTAGHWPAVYLPRAGVPLARGWFRQDDFPQNRVLYEPLHRDVYLRWLRQLGVRYVVVSNASPDYSARSEKRLIDSGRSGLHRVSRSGGVSIYEVPSPQEIVTGTGRPRVLSFESSKLVLELGSAGAYRIAVRYSPYWHTDAGCLSPSHDGMLRLRVARPTIATLAFEVDTKTALDAIVGVPTRQCANQGGDD
jgi:hypothetical protein